MASGIRRFNNAVKDQLFRELSGKTLLEIGVGRGGDLHKWVKYNIPMVRGFDIDERSLEEARKRTFEKESALFRKLDYQYFLMRDLEHVLGQQTFGAVSCQFAIHYFFDCWESVDYLLGTVSRHLETGGYFICTTFDADRLPVPFENAHLSVQPTDHSNRILVHLRDTPYFEGSGNPKPGIPGIPEYRVYPESLIGACDEHKLDLVRKIPFRFFLPKLKGTISLTPEEKEVCFLYNAYIFKKL